MDEKKTIEIGEVENGMIRKDESQDEAEITPLDESEKMNGKDGDSQSKDEHLAKYHKKYVPGRGIERYNNSLKNLIPIRGKGKDRGTMGIDRAGLFSFMSTSWISKFMYQAHKKGLKMEELPDVSPYDTCDYNADRLEILWKDELAARGSERASLSKVAWKFCQTRIFTSSIVQVLNVAFGILSNTIFMRGLLKSVQSGDAPFEEGAKWALMLTASEMARAFFWAWSWSLNYTTALRLRSACLTLVYRKIIGVNNLGGKGVGEVINVFSNDAQRVFDMLVFGPLIIQAPIATVCGIWYILYLLGPMALLGMIVFLLFFPIQYTMSKLTGYLRTKIVTISDLRMRLMNEILDCIKLIKMYAWEKRFRDDLLDVRKSEQRVLLKTSYTQNLSVSIAAMVPVLSTTVTMIAHVATGHNLTVAEVFPYTSYLNTRFRVALITFQEGLEAIVSGVISLNRVKSLLLMQDGRSCAVLKPILKSQAVAINNGTFAYNNSSHSEEEGSLVKKAKRENGFNKSGEKSEREKLNEPALNGDVLIDISFEAEKGKLVGICGQVGSGKSSLLLAALGQLRVSEGQVTRDGSCAYVSQQAWITNATLKENILFGSKFDHNRYHKTIHACNLIQDIEMMPGGDQTEIGEKGVNLSGGQKQRVALARALYADRDIYFLDDPLSAVDSRVGSYIFNNLILKALRGKTVLFVTHQIQYLNRCDDVYMMRDGRIIEHGTHDELMKLGNEYATMVAAISADNETDNETTTDPTIKDIPDQPVEDVRLHDGDRDRVDSDSSHVSSRSNKNLNNPEVPLALTVADYVHEGTIKAHTYHSYIMAAGGYFSMLIVVLMFSLSIGSSALNAWWLAVWIQAGGGNITDAETNSTIFSDDVHDNPNFSYYQTIYVSTTVIVIFSSLIRTWAFTSTTMRAATKIHNVLFEKIIDSPTRFFDVTPSGRITHLFSRDMDEVDNRLPAILTYFIQNLLLVFFAVLVISLVFPWFVLPMVVIIGIFYFISKIFRLAIGDLKRMDDKSRAPVIGFVTATLQGLSTIHAFEKERDFMRRFTNLFDNNTKYMFMFAVASRWVATRIDALSVAVTGTTAALVVALRDQVPPTLAGLALAYSAQISGIFEYTVRIVTETEARFTSVERINHYLRTLEKEDSSEEGSVRPRETWPEEAEIRFKGVCMAYGEGAPLILKNITFSVHSREKIGIVGRTGSGKSSLIVALFRLVELAEGKIEIDDVDVSKISLSQLRMKLAIIPQDPVLFSGTIRSNLDPFKLCTDAEIWKALEKTELKSRVQSITGQLDAPIGSGGDNLSVGERQLLCLSRALLRNSKILVLDEATAAVDPETEIAVQKTIQQEFSDCTILTIAHRLKTVMSLERVLVMDSGKVLEFDTPSNLLKNPSSEFSKMIAAAERAEAR